MEFSDENIINAVQNEPCIWDSVLNATEETKELAWKRIADTPGQRSSVLKKNAKHVIELYNKFTTRFQLVYNLSQTSCRKAIQ